MLVLMTLTLALVMGMAALAIDLGAGWGRRADAQKASDAAALAGADVLYDGGTAVAARNEALAYALKNGFDSTKTTVYIPPISGPHTGDSEYIEVRIAGQQRTTFAGVLGIANMNFSARAVAEVRSGEGNYAIFANENSCGVSDALELNGSVEIVNGRIHSNSHLKIPGSSNDFNGDVTYNCGVQNSGSGNQFDPGSPANGGVRPMPVNYTLATTSSTSGTWTIRNTDSGASVNCTRKFNGDVNLSNLVSGGVLPAGVYCSKGKMELSGQNTTGNVTLAAQGTAVLNGSNFNLTAYWDDLLFFTTNSSSSAMDIAGSGGNWTGILFAPNGKAKVNGQSNLSISGSIIADQVQVSGSNLNLTALDGSSGDPGTRLVE
jgi:hypothetical protein